MMRDGVGMILRSRRACRGGEQLHITHPMYMFFRSICFLFAPPSSLNQPVNECRSAAHTACIYHTQQQSTTHRITWISSQRQGDGADVRGTVAGEKSLFEGAGTIQDTEHVRRGGDMEREEAARLYGTRGRRRRCSTDAGVGVRA
jgi:hypothetical protein